VYKALQVFIDKAHTKATNEIKVSTPTIIVLLVSYFENDTTNQTAHCLSSSHYPLMMDALNALSTKIGESVCEVVMVDTELCI